MAQGVEITRSDTTAAELRSIAARTRDSKAARRLLAIAMVIDGADRTSAATACGMDRQTLRDWVHRFNDEGVDGLSNRRVPGPSRALSEAQMAELAGWVEAGANVETDGVVRWRCVDLKDRIKERFGIDYHERTIGKLLAALELVRISVRPQHPNSNPAAQEAFKTYGPPRRQGVIFQAA